MAASHCCSAAKDHLLRHRSTSEPLTTLSAWEQHPQAGLAATSRQFAFAASLASFPMDRLLQ
jgi:hypothetical protein